MPAATDTPAFAPPPQPRRRRSRRLRHRPHPQDVTAGDAVSPLAPPPSPTPWSRTLPHRRPDPPPARPLSDRSPAGPW